MIAGLGEGQHRRDASLRPPEMRGPGVPVARGEQALEARLQRRPAVPVVLVHLRRIDPQSGQQGGEEPRLQRRHRDETAVGAGIAAIEGGAAIKQVTLPRRRPQAARRERVEQGRQHADPVGHGRIDDPALARAAGPDHGRQHAADQQHGPSAVVGDKVERR